MRTVTEEHHEPQSRIRINTVKNSRGYNYETTEELAWYGTATTIAGSDQTPQQELANLQQLSHRLAKEEIARREKEDSLTLGGNGLRR